MKNYTTRLFLLILLIFIIKTNAQENEFKIGMFGMTSMHNINAVTENYSPLTYPTTQQFNNTSSLNVLHEDGFNIIYGYKPDVWTATKKYQDSLLKLTSKFDGMKILLHAREWYIPGTATNNHTIGDLNMYKNYGMSITDVIPARPNYKELISQVYNVNPNKELIWGYQISEESTSHHLFNGKKDMTGENLVRGDIPLEHTQAALNYFKNKVDPAHKLVIMEAAHGQAINDNTILDDLASNPYGLPMHAPQDYIKLDNVDVFFEGSYMSLTNDWLNQSYGAINSNQGHYLGALKSIDYAYQYVDEVHDVISMERNYFEVDDNINYVTATHSNPSIKNANWMWFKTYSSIIHGAKGIWFWDLTHAFDKCEKSELLINNGHYTNTDIVNKAKTYVQWIVDPNITWSCNSEEIIEYEDVDESGDLVIKEIKVRLLYEKAVNELFNDIDERFNEDYFPVLYKDYVKHLARELKYLVDKNLISTDPNSIIYTKTDHADTNCIVPPAEEYIPEYLQTEKRNENYGLRYSIRTNGDETIMIITNPLNVVVKTTLNFDNLANEVIQNSYGVDVLFESNESVYSTTYKTNRNSDIDLNGSTVGQQYFKSFTSGKKLQLQFGPLDTHILKFKSSAPVVNTDGWTKEWTNHGNGKIDGWDVHASHKFYVGDFDGDQVEELLCVQTKNDENWITMLNYENGDWHWKWSNYGDASHMLVPYRTNFLIGDFDADGKDELLGNPEIGWITMFHFENGQWQWGWSDYGNHAVTPYKENIIVGNFDGGDRDEIFGSPEYGWSTMFKFEDDDFQWAWSTYGNDHGIRPYRNLVAGDFDNDGKDEILGLDSWATMFHFEDNDFQWGWSTNNATTFGGWGYPLDQSDKVLIGDIDSNDTKDEILFIQRGGIANWATSMDLKDDGSDWNWNWSANNDYSLPYIYDWSINGTEGEYLLIKAEANSPKQLLALRPYGWCEYENGNYLISMYKPFGNKNNISIKKEEIDLDNRLNITIHPNPFINKVNVSFKELQSGRIEILNIYGYVYRQKEFVNKNKVELNLKDLNSGVYIVKFYIGEEVYVRKIIKY